MPERRQRTWDATTGTEIKVLRGHDDWVGSAAFSPDGTRSSPPRATARRGFGTRWLGRSQRASRSMPRLVPWLCTTAISPSVTRAGFTFFEAEEFLRQKGNAL